MTNPTLSCYYFPLSADYNLLLVLLMLSFKRYFMLIGHELFKYFLVVIQYHIDNETLQHSMNETHQLNFQTS